MSKVPPPEFANAATVFTITPSSTLLTNHRPFEDSRELDPDFLATGELPTPFNVWNWSQQVHGGPPCAYDSSTWMPRLMERSKARITQYGLEFEGLNFDEPESEEFQSMKRDSAHGRVKYLPIHVDRLTTNQIYLVPEDITEPPRAIKLSHVSRFYKNLTFKEVRIRKEWRKVQTDDAEFAHKRRVQAQAKTQNADTDMSLAKVKEMYGSFSARQRIANGTDIEAVAAAQAEADNGKITNAIHGFQPAIESPIEAHETSTTNVNRPKCLSD